MEPERKIEKLLRAYAEKRRAAAGEPMKLHPATRRLLQGEAARAAPKPRAEDGSVSLWQLLRRQWAVLFGFAMVIFLGASLFLPTLAAAKRKAQSVSAMNNLKQIGAAAQFAAADNNGRLPASLDAFTNGLVTENILNDPASGQRFVYLGGGENLDNLQSNSLLAFAPVDNKGREVLFADGRVEFANRARFSELTNQNSFQLALAKSAVREPAKQPPAGTFAADESSTLPTPPASMELADKEKASKSIDRSANASASRELEAAKAGSGGEERQKLEQPAPAATMGGALALGTPTNNFKAGGEFGLAANLPAAAPPPAASPELTLNDRLMTTQQLAYRNTSTQTVAVQVARRDSVVVSQMTTGAWQNAFPNAPASRPAAAVLANFQVQQNGTTLRVVDADGSVYAGTLLPASNNVQIASIQAAGKTLAKDSPQQTAPTISFQVTGINQALQQKVVFTGNIEPMPVTVENAQSALHNENAGTAGTQIQQNNANLQPQTWLSNTRIVGTAIIDPTNQIQIIAVPASP